MRHNCAATFAIVAPHVAQFSASQLRADRLILLRVCVCVCSASICSSLADIWCLSSEINPLPALLNGKGLLWGAELLSATVSWLKAQGICMKLDFVGLGPVAELAGASQFEAAILSYLQQFVEVLLHCCFA